MDVWFYVKCRDDITWFQSKVSRHGKWTYFVQKWFSCSWINWHGITWKCATTKIQWALRFRSLKNRLVDQKVKSWQKSQPLQNVILISFCNETMYSLINEWKPNVLNEMIMSVCVLKTGLLNDFLTKNQIALCLNPIP